MIKSFRLQLTAWYLLLFTVLFVGFSLFFYGLLSRGVYQRLDSSLSSQARTAASLLREELSEHTGDAPAAAAEVIREMSSPPTVLAVFEDEKLLAASAAVDPRDWLDLPSRALSGETVIHATLTRFGRNRSTRVAAHPFAVDSRR